MPQRWTHRRGVRGIHSVEDAVDMALQDDYAPLTTALLGDCLSQLAEVRRLLLRLSARR